MRGILNRLHKMGGGRFAALASLAVRVIAAGLAAVLQVALARLLGADNYGLFAWAWTLVTVGGYAATMGLSQTAVRFLALYAERDANAAARGFLVFAGGAVAAGALLASAAGAAVVLNFGQSIDQGRIVPLLLVLATIPFFALGDLAEGFARSQGWSILALAPGYIVRQVLLLLLLPALILFGASPDAISGLGVALAATAITGLGQLGYVLRCLNPLFGGVSPEFSERGRWIAATVPVFLADIVQVLRQNMDVLILAAFVEPAQLAIYFAATRIAALLGLVEFAVGAAAAHRFARIDASKDARGLAAAARGAALLTFWPTLAAAVVLWLASPLFLAMFGEGYRGADGLVTVLILGAVVRAAVGPADDFLTMQGHADLNLLAQISGLVASVLAALVFIPGSGAAGAAAAALVATAVSTLTLAVGSGIRTGIVPLPLLDRRFFRRQPA